VKKKAVPQPEAAEETPDADTDDTAAEADAMAADDTDADDLTVGDADADDTAYETEPLTEELPEKKPPYSNWQQAVAEALKSAEDSAQ